MKKIFVIFILVIILTFQCVGCKNNNETKGTDISGNLEDLVDFSSGFKQTTATDDYGRKFSAVTDYNKNVVGIFYFLWLSQAAVDTNVDSYANNKNIEKTLNGEEVPYGPTFTYWGEPMYGYYKVEDEWVVRKHVELFINAGLDFICFDSTNNDYYQGAAKTVLDILLEYKNLGYDVPKAMFMTNSDSTTLTSKIYNAFYKRSTYDSIWFYGNGQKPWILADYGGNDSAIKNRFYFKKAQWPNDTILSEGFPWMSWRYPQETYIDKENDYKIMNVSVSQHTGIGGVSSDEGIAGVNFSLSGICAPYNYNTLSDYVKSIISPTQAKKYYNHNWGRGYSHAVKENIYEQADANINFNEQWESVYNKKDINLVFLTGWNEWIAQKQSKDSILGSSYGYFVDTFSKEFSRDIEMMKDGYLDNCYLQMVAGIRKFKGAGFNSVNYRAKVDESLNMLDLSSWKKIDSYADLVKETIPRASSGAGKNYYENKTGRNDIKQVKVVDKNDDIYFMIETVDDITKKDEKDSRWMNLFIGVDGQEDGFNKLQYVVNRTLNGNKSSIDKISKNNFTNIGECETFIKENVMIIKINKNIIGINANNISIQFKVADNLLADFDITDLYTNGDVAPIGRINYTYFSKEKL